MAEPTPASTAAPASGSPAAPTSAPESLEAATAATPLVDAVSTGAEPAVTPSDQVPAQANGTTAAATPGIVDLSPNACAAKLAELFPAVFAAGAAKPLKLRIQADIQARAPAIFSRKTLSNFLHRHTTSTGYLKSLAASPVRFDLDGAPAGEVADEHRQAALAELERRRAAHADRRAAERDAQRQAHREAQQQAMREFALQGEARRERAGLLRAFESTTLTLANFCALKGIAADELQSRLAQARQEREEAAQAPQPPRVQPHGPADARPPQRPRPNGPSDAQRRPQRQDGRQKQRPRRDAAGGETG